GEPAYRPLAAPAEDATGRMPWQDHAGADVGLNCRAHAAGFDAPARRAISGATTRENLEAAFVKQISREMSYPARPLPVLPQASAAVVTAQMEASQQVAFERHSVSQAVDTFMATARMAIGR